MQLTTRAGRVHPVPVVLDPKSQDLAGHDYADAFEMQLRHPDGRSAEELVRSGLEGAPAPVRGLVRLVHRHVLRFQLGPDTSPGHVLGWRVVDNELDRLRLEAESVLGRGVILAQRRGSSTVSLQTFLFYRRPTAARRTWKIVGPLHRTVAPLLLVWAARQPAPASR